MYIKLKKSDLYCAIIAITLIAECWCFRLFEISDDIFKYVIIIMLIFLYLAYLLDRSIRNRILQYSSFVRTYILIMFAFFFFEYIYMEREYSWIVSPYNYFVGIKTYFFALMTPIVLYIFVSRNDVEKLLDMVTVISTITLVLVLIHAFVYNRSGRELLNITFYQGRMISRHNRLRVWDVSSVEALAIIYSVWHFVIKKYNRWLYLVIILVDFLTLIYVEQTRMMQICLAASIFTIILSKQTANRSSVLMKGMIMFIIMFLVVQYIIPHFISSLKDYSFSTSIRLIEIDFATKAIREKPILGIGIVDSYTQIRDYLTNIKQMYLGDIGLMGFAAQVGLLWSFLLYLLPIIRMIYILSKVKDNDNYCLLSSLLVYLIASSVTLLIMTKGRIPMWPFILAIFEYCYYKEMMEEKEVLYNIECVDG